MTFARTDIEAMGYSVRGEGARYTEWRTWSGAALEADWSAAGLLGAALLVAHGRHQDLLHRRRPPRRGPAPAAD